jgi:hypothetical protein
MQEDFNRNDRQLNFNTVKGIIAEIIDEPTYSAIILDVGHEKQRKVYLSIPTIKLQDMKDIVVLGRKVEAKFYIASKLKSDRWFTNVNVLSISPVKEI